MYSQIGNVILAIFLCLSNILDIALTYVTRTIGTMNTDNVICVIKIKKYKYLIKPSPPKGVGSVVM